MFIPWPVLWIDALEIISHECGHVYYKHGLDYPTQDTNYRHEYDACMFSYSALHQYGVPLRNQAIIYDRDYIGTVYHEFCEENEVLKSRYDPEVWQFVRNGVWQSGHL